MKDLVSVIVPVYNAEKYVRKAVESAVHFEVVKEVILIEDKSPDNALEVCMQLEKEYEKVKLHQHPDKGNHGAGPSRNLGIEKATGEWIAFLDADDYYLPNRFDKEIELLFAQQEFHGMGQAIGTHNYKLGKVTEKMTTIKADVPPGELFNYLLGFNLDNYALPKKHIGRQGHFSIDGYTFRKAKLLENQINFPPLELHQDSVFILKAVYYLNPLVGFWQEPVAMRGVHEENRITAKKQGWVEKRVSFFDYLSKWCEDNDLPKKYKQEFLARKHEFLAYEVGQFFDIFKYLFYTISNPRMRFHNRGLRCIKYCLGIK